MTSSLRALAEAHVTPVPPGPPLICKSPYAFRGDDLPLMLSKGLVKPGLESPPAAEGDEERDNGMVTAGGVPGTGDKSFGAPRNVSADVAPTALTAAALRISILAGDLPVEERRRDRDSPTPDAVPDWEASLSVCHPRLVNPS